MGAILKAGLACLIVFIYLYIYLFWRRGLISGILWYFSWSRCYCVLEVFLEQAKSLKRNGKPTKQEVVQVEYFIVKKSVFASWEPRKKSELQMGFEPTTIPWWLNKSVPLKKV